MRPQNCLRCIAIKRPVALRAVFIFELKDLISVLDLQSQQVSVLVANLIGSALQMHVRPATTRKGISAFEAVVMVNRGLSECRNDAETQRQGCYTYPATTIGEAPRHACRAPCKKLITTIAWPRYGRARLTLL